MKIRTVIMLMLMCSTTGCAAIDHLFCAPACQSESHNTSSLVNFLYADGKALPREDVVPELHVPLRIGLAFLPSQNNSGNNGLEAARKEELLEQGVIVEE